MRRIALYGLIALLAGLYLLPFMRVLSGATDEGLYVYASQEAAEGAIPGRDFVQENPPGAYYWLALFFRLFGTSMMTARVVLLLTGVASVLVLVHLARRIGSNGLFAGTFFLITCIPLTPINSPHYDSNLFALLAFAAFLKGTDSLLEGEPRQWPFVVAGTLAGWVSCILQQKGFLFLVAFCATLLVLHSRRGLRGCLLMAISYASVLVAELVPYVMWGALPDLFYSNVVLPLSSYQGVNQVVYGYPLWTVWFPKVFAHVEANASALVTGPTLLLMSLPFLLLLAAPLAVAALAYWHRYRVFDNRWIPYWITAYAMLLSELHRQDLSHFRNACILLVLLFFAICDRIGTRWLRFAAIAVVLGAIMVGATDLAGTLSLNHPVTTRRGTLLAKARDPVLEFLISHTQPGDYAFVYPYSPAYYFLADLRNPTPLNVIVDQRRNRLIEQAITGLDTKKPRYAIADTKLLGDHIRTLFPNFRPPDPKDRVIDRYIDAHYHQVGFEDGFRILERNSD
ncbi:MAG: glycosyltransferase family 39 protein [Acidobacteriaceae bacterium]|nr:glycosyltransferase family 39 protein [Acidobacteriaceae bacterium]